MNEKVERIVLKIQSIVADQVEGDYKLFLFGSRANGKSMDLQIKCADAPSQSRATLLKVLEETPKRSSNNSYIFLLDPYQS